MLKKKMMLSTLLLALIASQSYAATLTVTVQGSGTISSAPAGVTNCSSSGGTCSADFSLGKGETSVSVELSATGQVSSWSGDVPTTCATNSTCSIEMVDVAKNVTVTFGAAVEQCSATKLSACTQDNCATLGNGVWNTTTNVCDAKTIPVCSSTALSACTQSDCATLGNGVWNTTTNVCDAKTIPVCSSTTLSACTQNDCATLGNGVWNTATNVCGAKTIPVCNSTTLSACTQDNCATLGGGTWNTTTNPNRCDKVVTPEKVTLTVIPPTNGKLLCDGVDCVNGKQYDSGTTVAIQGVAVDANYSPSAWTNDALAVCTSNPCQFTLNGNKTIGAIFKAIPQPSACNENSLSVCNQTDCETKTNGKGLWNTAAQTPICIAKPDLEPLEALAINKAGALETPKALFFGGAKKGTSVSQTFSQGETISIDGVVFPETAHLNQLVDVIVLGRHVPALSAGQTVDDCNPQTGDYYINVKNSSYRDNYCSLDIISTKDVIQQHGNALFEELCNSASKTWNPEGKTCGGELLANALQSSWLNEAYCKRIKGSWNTSSLTCNVCNSSLENTLDKDLIRRSISAQTYWNRWSGKLNDLKPLASGFLSERTELTGLYMDTLNYTGHVCINFGYRLENGTIVFNGNPIKYRVSQ